MPSIIFRKGLDLRDAVAGTLNADYHSALVERVKAEDYTYRDGRLTVASRPGVRLLLRRRSRRGLRLPDAPPIPGPPHPPDGRDHPQPARQREAPRAGHPVPAAARPDAIERLGPDDVVILPAFGVTVDALARFEARDAPSSTRPAGPCSTSGRPSGGMRRTASPRSSTGRSTTRRPARPRRRRCGSRAVAT